MACHHDNHVFCSLYPMFVIGFMLQMMAFMSHIATQKTRQYYDGNQKISPVLSLHSESIIKIHNLHT